MKLLNPADVEYIVVHCSDTFSDVDLDVATVKKWHMSPDPKDLSKPWEDVGYHFFIKRDGKLQHGRDIQYQGSHVKGYNWKSIGVCLAGGKSKAGTAEFNFTQSQILTLISLITDLKNKYAALVVGHRDLFSGKQCPCFNVKAFFQ